MRYFDKDELTENFTHKKGVLKGNVPLQDAYVWQ